jgi:hypothetical protein
MAPLDIPRLLCHSKYEMRSSLKRSGLSWFFLVLGALAALWIVWEIWFGLTQAR